LVTRGKKALSSERHEECAALGGMARMLMLLETKVQKGASSLTPLAPS
jgi:hypothetical protein